MSRIGKKPVPIPAGVTVDLKDETLKVKGPKGELALTIHPKVTVSKNDSEIIVSVKHPDEKSERALWGLFRALINNMVVGVTTGFTKILEINGVGYKAASSGKKLVLNLGFSHPIEMEVPPGLEAQVEKNVITITGSDRQAVGQFAAVVRSQRKPEPYKGKGIKYQDEIIRRKAGKVVKAVGGGK
ncbi:MAG: 50S ribosomal protein L6 [Candidatus Doudnabacteria bacterium RIFCSPHIGHO2_01_FULL_45_18]|uniref:Large ribosomal subunit protein uL6 n=1 Tax=Candidatus Doudnabacteria bacterium RIFCSPHIGHO2_01_FULL_45_18 TaxID=1817823 RepID=A0A1F5NR28_9BACT|nr:ribosomal protein L6 [uncultured bacterium]OGE80131.1 MAG: 50S ribosomal protein L6 [Candidatus Doudnabacteria bacterium RIFCSPHIGHO2_01_FULL_45_18]